MHEILEPTADLFNDRDRWPKRPFCKARKEGRCLVLGLQEAIGFPYIQANAPHARSWLIFDLDDTDSAHRWEDANLPEPTWAAVNRYNGHAHLAWGLRTPVLLDGNGVRQKPMRYLWSIEAMMRERLGADISYNGVVTKNPAHDRWMTIRGSKVLFDLHELAEYLPGLERFVPTKRDGSAGLGRNVTLFDALRRWSYRAIRSHWTGSLDAWRSACMLRASEMSADLFGERSLTAGECKHIAYSVARWTWKRFSEREYLARQKALAVRGGKASGQSRRLMSAGPAAIAKAMSAAGSSQAAIAESLGVTQSAVSKWLRKNIPEPISGESALGGPFASLGLPSGRLAVAPSSQVNELEWPRRRLIDRLVR